MVRATPNAEHLRLPLSGHSSVMRIDQPVRRTETASRGCTRPHTDSGSPTRGDHGRARASGAPSRCCWSGCAQVRPVARTRPVSGPCRAGRGGRAVRPPGMTRSPWSGGS